MFAILFANPRSGRLARLPYLGGYFLVIALILFVVALIDTVGLLLFGDQIKAASALQLMSNRPFAADPATLFNSDFFDQAGYSLTERLGTLVASFLRASPYLALLWRSQA